MQRVQKILDHTHAPDDTITLDETARHRRRMKMVSDNAHGKGAIEFMLDLPQAVLLRTGNGLALDDGRVIEVQAAPEPLYEIRAKSAHHLLTLTWQLGNRHLASQIFEDHILIRQDAVIKKMLEGLGASVSEINAPFDPEGGAYSGTNSGGHSHSHSHSHDHEDAHAHEHSHD